jgi:hypothetical protein
MQLFEVNVSKLSSENIKGNVAIYALLQFTPIMGTDWHILCFFVFNNLHSGIKRA